MPTDERLGRLEPANDEMYEHLKKEITKRLRRVCERMPDAEFDELVGRMARLELKYRGRDGR